MATPVSVTRTSLSNLARQLTRLSKTAVCSSWPQETFSIQPCSINKTQVRRMASHDIDRQTSGPATLEHKNLPSQVEDSRVAAARYFPEFNMQGKVVIVTGGGRGLGLTMAQALYQGGAIVHCLDRLAEPDRDFLEVQNSTDDTLGGKLHYHSIDIRDTRTLQQLIADIAAETHRLDGLIAAAGVQKIQKALDYTAEEAQSMLEINYTACLMTAQATAAQMIRYKTPGSIVMIGSMSGMVANKGLISTVYNSSKAAINQLARNLAMEWGPHGIRVNSLCPGHIITPMVRENFKEVPELKNIWEKESMLCRLSKPEEFRGAAIFLLSNASSYMTGTNLMIDGGHTAW